MSRSTNIALAAATLVTMLGASSVLARPQISQLNSADMGVGSQQRIFGISTRAADDFVLPLGNHRNHTVTRIELVMIGDGTASRDRFGFTIFRNTRTLIGADYVGSELHTRVGASSVVRLGSAAGWGMSKYLVTFNIPAGQIRLAPNEKFYISGFGTGEDFRNWGMARTTLPTRHNPAWGNIGYPVYAWSWAIPWGDLAFRITTTQ